MVSPESLTCLTLQKIILNLSVFNLVLSDNESIFFSVQVKEDNQEIAGMERK